MVSSVTVRDQSSQKAYINLVSWADTTLGLTSPNTLFRTDHTNQYAYYKKVEVDFYLSHSKSSDTFKAKQQLMGYASTTNPNTLQQYQDWWQDGPYPYTFATQNYQQGATPIIILQDDPGFFSHTINFPGNGVVDEDVYNMHFRDKIKWHSPSDQNDYDVYGGNSPDPYFGYWARYVDIWTSPAAPPQGTNNYYKVGTGGNY
jgi:hypothetical protein